jgi:tetratricopeptide (TPR) repeat protein
VERRLTVAARLRGHIQGSPLLPHPGNYDTLGWAEFKLHENDRALQDLLSAERLCADSCRPSTNWQEIEFHLGSVYAELKKKQQARQAFRAVLKYQQEAPELSKDKYVQLAKASLGAS